MKLDLERTLEATRKGQWSIHDYDWSQPVINAETLNSRERKEAGLALLFTAGLERQAAKVFRLNARYVTDPNAKKIFDLFAIDETRHADAEVLLARRLGATWADLPLPARLFFKGLGGDWAYHGRYTYQITASIIILFELALDSILITTLKNLIDDPLQTEIFLRIDQDESRHLAMDYWLLDYNGQHGLQPARPNPKLARTLAAAAPFAPLGLMLFLRASSSMQRRIRPEHLARYWKKVQAIQDKAPHAMKVEAYRKSVGGLSKTIDFFTRNPGLFRGLFLRTT